MSRLENELRARFGARLLSGAPLAELTSLRIGGPADLLLVVDNEDELRAAMAAASRECVSAFCLGSGTNLLVSDRGVRGLVVRLGGRFARLEFDGARVRAGAAVRFGHLVEEAVERGLRGLEFGEGIPGSVGGGLVMNAGAFGGEIARVVRVVHGVNEQGEPLALGADDVKFSYRRTELPPRFVITRVDFELEPGDREALRARVAEIHQRRESRQPRRLPNAGSIFKNPPGNFAGRLLEGVGLKGARFGGAEFSAEHANFIVNTGGARAEDVRALIELAQSRVKEVSGIMLEPEVRMVGDW